MGLPLSFALSKLISSEGKGTSHSYQTQLSSVDWGGMHSA